MPRTEDQLLEVVYQRSATIRRRRRTARLLAVALTGLVLIAVPLFAMSDLFGSDRAEVRPIASHDRTGTDERPSPSPAEAKRPAERAPVVGDDRPQGREYRDPKAVPARTTRPESCPAFFADEDGDVRDSDLDLVRTELSSDAERFEVTHTLRDLTDVYSTGEEVRWDLRFALDGARYILRASHGSKPTGSDERFELLRADGSKVADAFGAIDTRGDTVQVIVSRSDLGGSERFTLSGVQSATATSKLAAPAGDESRSPCDIHV